MDFCKLIYNANPQYRLKLLGIIKKYYTKNGCICTHQPNF